MTSNVADACRLWGNRLHLYQAPERLIGLSMHSKILLLVSFGRRPLPADLRSCYVQYQCRDVRIGLSLRKVPCKYFGDQ